MTHRPTTEQDRAAIKASVRNLVRSMGGQEQAAEVTRVSHQTLSRYANRAQGDDHMPLDVLMDLTMDADDPCVIRTLCRLANGVFVPLPRAASPLTNWPAAVGKAVKSGAEAAEAICSALSEEGQISPEEIADRQILDKLASAIEALVVLQNYARQVAEQEGEA